MSGFSGRVFSGVQPTGNLHLGNYLGAISRFVELQDRFECLYCVVDLHALTVTPRPDELRRGVRETAAAFFAAGIDDSRHAVFVQSSVSSHAELSWILSCVARIGWLNRMTQFKEKAGRNRENASVGLYAYPVLMAADILAYRATHVPVGSDQKQHLELARDIAAKFNHEFGTEFFPLPEPLIEGPAPRVMSLRDGSAKMSKSDSSDYSRINLSDSADAISAKIRKARTDSFPVPVSEEEFSSRPEAANLVGLLAALRGESVSAVFEEFGGGSFSSLKEELVDRAVSCVLPLGDEMRRLTSDPAELDRRLSLGSEKARAMSSPILREAKRLSGLVSSPA